MNTHAKKSIFKFYPLSYIAMLSLMVLPSCTSTLRPSSYSKTAITPVLLTSENQEKRTSDLLTKAVNKQGLVDYPSLVKSPEELNTIYANIAAQSPDSHPTAYPNEKAKFAYWLNAYNSTTLYAVVKAYPIKSVRDHKPASLYSLVKGGGFFAAQKFLFGNKAYSLYQLENSLIRKRFSDPRLHFALNCASIGCPDLLDEAYQESKLHAQLDQQTRAFINSEKGFQIDHDTKTIQISAIFDWYESDFISFLTKEGVHSPEILDYLAPYLEKAKGKELQKARSQNYKLDYLPYDWSLNQQLQ